MIPPHPRPKPVAGSKPSLGVAGSFGPAELKTFFVNYLTSMLVVEGLIFFVAFVYRLSGEATVFPWRPYIFASFAAPLAITFVFGVILKTFNRYLHRAPLEAGPQPPEGGDLLATGRLPRALGLLHQVPFLLSLLLLLLLLFALYHAGAIALFLTQVGEQALRYILLALGVVLAVAALGGLVWMLLSYRLRKARLESEYHYRREVMERTGLVILGEDRVVDREGRLLGPGGAPAMEGREQTLILPAEVQEDQPR
jgi:hypothetical protein